MDINAVIKALERNRYDKVSFFHTAEDATEYLKEKLVGKVIGFGDSATMEKMELNKALSEKNTVIDPKPTQDNDEFLKVAKVCLTTEVFLTSVNAMSEDGIFVNIDGTGNRVAGSLFGHDQVYFIISTNKIEKTWTRPFGEQEILPHLKIPHAMVRRRRVSKRDIATIVLVRSESAMQCAFTTKKCTTCSIVKWY